MKKILKTAIFIACAFALFGCSDSRKTSEKINIKEEMPEYVEYENNVDGYEIFMIKKEDSIKKIVKSVRSLQIGEKVGNVDIDKEKFSDAVYLHYSNGEIAKIILEGNYFLNYETGEKYEIANVEEMREIIEKAIEEIEPIEEKIVLCEIDLISEKRAYEIFTSRGFAGESVVYNYSEDGKELGEKEINSASEDKHPMYTLRYRSEDNCTWKVNLIGESIFATPLSIGDEKIVDRIIVYEGGDICDYIPETNEFHKIDPFDKNIKIRGIESVSVDYLNMIDKDMIDGIITGY